VKRASRGLAREAKGENRPWAGFSGSEGVLLEF
jgi:hypothetical protein